MSYFFIPFISFESHLVVVLINAGLFKSSIVAEPSIATKPVVIIAASKPVDFAPDAYATACLVFCLSSSVNTSESRRWRTEYAKTVFSGCCSIS